MRRSIRSKNGLSLWSSLLLKVYLPHYVYILHGKRVSLWVIASDQATIQAMPSAFF